jgi:hypothetical protein
MVRSLAATETGNAAVIALPMTVITTMDDFCSPGFTSGFENSPSQAGFPASQLAWKSSSTFV